MRKETSVLSKVCESFIYNYFNRNKKTMCVRFSDTHDTFQGRGKGVILSRKPSDFIVVNDGYTFFCEVKSTEDQKGVRRKLLERQFSRMLRIKNCGGNFVYYIYSKVRDSWFSIDSKNITEDFSSMEWSDMREEKDINLYWKMENDRI